MAKQPKSAQSNAVLSVSMLSYNRSIQISEAVMNTVLQNGEVQPIHVFEKDILGQTYSFKTSKIKPTDGTVAYNNPQVIDFAIAGKDAKQLEIAFSVKVLGEAMQPNLCSKTETYKALTGAAVKFAENGGFKTLAERYIWNIANARFAHRNRVVTENPRVTVTFDGKQITFNSEAVSLRSFDADQVMQSVTSGVEHYEGFVTRFADALGNVSGYFGFDVQFLGDIKEFEEVFPSQEFARDDAKAKRNGFEKARFLARIGNNNHASIHSQKIGNAIRTIDEFHGNDDFGAIVVNAYGGDRQSNKVLRYDEKTSDSKNFYEIMISDEPVSGDVTDNNLFFFANLVRGGVYGNVAKDENKKEAQA